MACIDEGHAFKICRKRQPWHDPQGREPGKDQKSETSEAQNKQCNYLHALRNSQPQITIGHSSFPQSIETSSIFQFKAVPAFIESKGIHSGLFF